MFKSTNGGGSWTAANTGLTNSCVYAWRLTQRRRARSMPGQWRRRVQEHERRRGLERGQHRPDRPNVWPWRLTRRPRARSMRGQWRRRIQEHERRRELERGQHRPDGTDVYALAIDPATPSTLYAGTGGGGVFKSTNGGGTWGAVNTGLTDTVVFALAIDPATPGTLYAGTMARRVQERERRRGLERGQHRPDRYRCYRPGD